jgi:hypothetical protein
VTGEQRVGDRRDHRAVVADDAGEQLLARCQFAPQVGADLGAHGLRAIRRALEVAEGLRLPCSSVLCLQPALGVDRRLAAAAGGSDRLAIARVGHVAAGKDSRDGGAGRRLFDQQVSGRDWSAAGLRRPRCWAGVRWRRRGPGSRTPTPLRSPIAQPEAAHAGVATAENLDHLGVIDPGDLRIGLAARSCMIFDARNSRRRWIDRDLRGEAREVGGLLERGVAATDRPRLPCP